MSVHIGRIIHEKVKNSSLTIPQLAKKLNRAQSTIFDIYKRESVDTNILLDLSKILNFNFFSLYDEVMPIKAMRENQVYNLQSKIKELEETLALQIEHINNLKEIISTQKEVMETMKKKSH